MAASSPYRPRQLARSRHPIEAARRNRAHTTRPSRRCRGGAFACNRPRTDTHTHRGSAIELLRRGSRAVECSQTRRLRAPLCRPRAAGEPPKKKKKSRTSRPRTEDCNRESAP
ncbi:hypothetical protein MTO96_013484 [Rhipicephalus appendiculatus]